MDGFWIGAVDMRSEMAPQTGVRGPANTGFLIIQPNMKTYTFAHSMVHLIPIMFWRACDQLAFNSIIRNHKFRQLHYETLPRRQFLDLHVEPNGAPGRVGAARSACAAPEGRLTSVEKRWGRSQLRRDRALRLGQDK